METKQLETLLKSTEKIRNDGYAILLARTDGPYARYNGKVFSVEHVNIANNKVCYTLNINGIDTDFYNNEVQPF